MDETREACSAPLTIKFGCERHDVDVDTYARVLLDFAEVMKAANRQASTNANIDVTITATGEGSFESFVQLVASHPLDSLQVAACLSQVAQVVVGMGVGAYKLHQWLAKRGQGEVELPELPARADTVVLRDHNGDSTTVNGDVYNFYMEQPAARDAMTRSFAVLEQDEAIDALEMLQEHREVFRADRDDFQVMSRAPAAVDERPSVVHETVRAVLSVIKVVFARTTSRKWEFIWGEHKISANIVDEKFLDRMDRGEAFSKGDALVCDLKITKEYEPTAGVYWNKCYTVGEVIQHIPAKQADQLF